MATELLVRHWFLPEATLRRTRYIARVLTHHGLGALAHYTGLRSRPGWRSGNGSGLTQPERLRIAIGELGATFIKLGQMLSTRSDLLPAEYVAELSKLQDAAPPVASDEIVAAIERDLDASLEKLFASFERAPLASASIGQVHGAVLLDGSRVVVKVQRPGVADEIERDLEILTRLVDFVANHTALGEDYDVRSLLDEFIYTIHGELDYVREGQNADRLRQFFAGEPRVHVPRVYWEHTRRRVLTLERVGGIKISDLRALDQRGVSRRAVAETAVRTFLREVMELGLYHADPHPGNFFVQDDGAIAIVDFGMVGRANPALQYHLLRCGLTAMTGDPEALAEELYALGIAGRRVDRRAFEKDLDHLIARYGGFSVSELSATAVTNELLEITLRHKLQLPSELALLLRVITMSEGIGLALDPDFRYLEYASPILREQWKRRTSIAARATQLGRAASEAALMAIEMPRRTERLLSRLERGDMQISVRHERLESVTREFQRMTNRLSLAMILAASVVALGVSLGAHRGDDHETLVRWLFMLGFVFSLGFGLWVLFGIVRSGRR